ncbi:MAG: TonB-dependent receptor, partial [Myxococcaceae bacterium]
MPTDARLEAFLADGPEVFASIQQAQSFWKPDPFDVESINTPARRAFERLVKRANRTPAPESGKFLLLQGESGSGKTHLVRAFRNGVHQKEQGYVGYMPMTVDAANYDRHILVSLIEALDRPYDLKVGEDSGLMRLSNAVMKRCTSAFAPLIPEESILEEHELHDMIRSLADELHEEADFRHVDVQLLRALIYLQRREARFHHRILQWLRCEDMAPADRGMIGDMVSRTADSDPMRMLSQLGRLMGVMGQALILCVDQIEDSIDFEPSSGMDSSFRRAMNSLVAFTGNVPTAIVVVCCLSDFWKKIQAQLTRSLLDRIEQDPEPVVLERLLTAETARDMVVQRLKFLYAQHNLSIDPKDPTYPIPAGEIEMFSGLRTRDLLNACRRFHERGMQDGRLPRSLDVPSHGQGKEQLKEAENPQRPNLEQAWTDFRAKFKQRVPEEDSEIAELLAWAIEVGGDELGGSPRFKVDPQDEESLNVTMQPGDAKMFVALCNKSSRGGHLGRQMADAIKSAARRVPVLVRTTDFPGSLGTLVEESTTTLMKRGGRRAVLGNSDLRELLALRAFRQQQPEPAFVEWSRMVRPVTRLKSITDVLALEKGVPPPEPARQAPPPPISSAKGTSVSSVTSLRSRLISSDGTASP